MWSFMEMAVMHACLIAVLGLQYTCSVHRHCLLAAAFGPAAGQPRSTSTECWAGSKVEVHVTAVMFKQALINSCGCCLNQFAASDAWS